jgi:hypothetical protein
MCQDGGDLWICNTCPRVFCDRCVVIDAKYLSLVAEDGVVFVRILCHWLKIRRGNSPFPYYICIYHIIIEFLKSDTVQGFYRGNQPLIPDIFVTVKGQFELDTRALLLSQPTCVVHLRLSQISSGGPVNMLTEYLHPYFLHGTFYEINLEFDITMKAKMKSYLTFAVDAAASLEQTGLKNIIFAITNHSEDDTGGLFLGTFKGTNIANDVGEVREYNKISL